MDTSLERRIVWIEGLYWRMHTRIQTRGRQRIRWREDNQRINRATTSMWQQDLQRTENSGRTLCMPPTLQLEDGTGRWRRRSVKTLDAASDSHAYTIGLQRIVFANKLCLGILSYAFYMCGNNSVSMSKPLHYNNSRNKRKWEENPETTVTKLRACAL